MDLHHLALHGVVSTADARAVGLDPYALRRLVRTDEIRRLIRGWYAVRDPGEASPPWEGADAFASARLWHRLRTIALLRSYEGRAIASHQSALVLHDVALWRTPLDDVHLCRTTDDHSRHRPAGVLHPATGTPPVSTAAGLLTVPVPTAVVQLGLGPTRVMGSGRPLESLIAADHALGHGLFTFDDLQAAVVAHAGHPGITAVRSLLTHADGRHQSVGETRLGHILRVLGYHATPQVPIDLGGSTAYVDFELDDVPVVVEFDGMAKYAGRGISVEAEKVREDRIRRRGKEVCRFIWPDLDHPHLIRAVIEERITLARMRRSA